jgi:SAM-dependent methyltransferase
MGVKTYLALKRELDLRYCNSEGGVLTVRPEYAWVGCPFCGPGARAEAYALPALARGLALVRCAICGVVHAQPRLSRQALDERVTHDLHLRYYGEGFVGPADPAIAAPEVAFIRHVMDPAWRVGLRALEVGCSSGTFLAALAAAGVQATGVDANAASVAHCRRQGLDARVGFFREDEFTTEAYDLIVFRESLYMLFDVRAALALARRLLVPEGLLYVRVFDVESVAFQLSAGASSGINMLDVPVAFSRASLDRVLRAARFRVVARTSASDPWLADVVLGPAEGSPSLARKVLAKAGSTVLEGIGRTRNFAVLARAGAEA